MVTDLMLFAGVVAASCGAGMLEPAAGLITGGALLLAGGVMRGLAEAQANDEAELAGKRGDR